jgi:signal transduction histidine kinase/Tfp pilus assembly protein PilF
MTNLKLFAFFFLLLGIPCLSAKKSYHLRNIYLQTVHKPVSSVEELLHTGEILMEQEKWRESLYYLLRADSITAVTGNVSLSFRSKYALYGVYYKLGLLDSANYFINDLLRQAVAKKDPKSEMDAWNGKAILFQTDLELDSAHYALSKAYELAVQLHNEKAQANFSSNLGIVFGQQGQYQKAKEYFRQAFDLGISSKDTMLIALGANNLTRVFTEAAQYDSATYYSNIAYRTSLAVRRQEPDYYYKTINFRALLEMRKGNYSLAEKKYRELAGIYEKLQENISLAEVYARLAEISLARKMAYMAIDYAQLNLGLLKNVRANEPREKALLVLTQAYHEIGDDQNAYHYAEQYRLLRDSVYNEKLAQLVTEMNNNFELTKKEQENTDLLIKAQLNEAARRNLTIIVLIVGLISAVAGGIILFFLQEIKHKKRLTRQLEAVVAQRTAALWESNKKLKSYVNELKTFSHISSHDLKEPLRNISGFISLLERKMGPDLDSDSREFMNYIRQNAAHMHELLEDILAYSTIEHQPSPTDVVALSDVMIKVRTSLQTLIEEKQANIICSDLPEIIANEAQIFMILKNLVENGIKYNRTPTPTINISYRKLSTAHLISVRDNGIGIPEEYREQVFQLFKRLHSRSEFSGTGMGLSISRKIAQRQGGDLRVEKSNAEGTVFALRLPLARQEITAAVPG